MQQELWHDDLTDALRALCEGLRDARGRPGIKPTACRLWPAMAPAQAHRKLLHCLDGDRAEKLALDEIDTLIRWGREQSLDVVPGYLAQRYGYQLRVITVDEQRDELKREFAAAVRAAQELGQRLEKLA